MPMLNVRLSDDEYSAVRTAAADRDQSLSEYVRDVLGIMRNSALEDEVAGLNARVEVIWQRLGALDGYVEAGTDRAVARQREHDRREAAAARRRVS